MSSEKTCGTDSTQVQVRRSSFNRYVKWLGLVLPGYSLARLSAKLPSGIVNQRHRSIEDIQWHPCPGISNPKIECGSIVIPLDNFDTSAGTATIALGKHKADPSIRRGSLFLNLDGPGGPAVQLAARAEPNSVATGSGPYYDLVGFDLRGIDQTVLNIAPFKSLVEMDEFYWDTVFELGNSQSPNSTISPSMDTHLARQYILDDTLAQQRQALALFEAQAKLCTKNTLNGGFG